MQGQMWLFSDLFVGFGLLCIDNPKTCVTERNLKKVKWPN